MPYKDPEKQRLAHLKYRNKTKEWFREYKRGLKCEKCGFSHPAALDFHHLGGKNAEITKLASTSKSKEAVMREIYKCQVLCSNCHRILHYEDGYSGGRPRNIVRVGMQVDKAAAL